MPDLRRILRFGLVGIAGFAADAGVLSLMIGTLGPYGGRLLSFAVAVGVTYLLNRQFTFADRRDTHAPRTEFTLYVISMIGGGAVNWAIYAIIINLVPHGGGWPVIAVGAGSLGGMALNLALAQRFVFPRRTD